MFRWKVIHGISDIIEIVGILLEEITNSLLPVFVWRASNDLFKAVCKITL